MHKKFVTITVYVCAKWVAISCLDTETGCKALDCIEIKPLDAASVIREWQDSVKNNKDIAYKITYEP